MNRRLPINPLATLLAIACLFLSQLPAASPQSPQKEAQDVKPDANTSSKAQVIKINADGKAEDVKPNAPAKASGITLNVGDPAPAIKAARWLKGSPIEAFKEGEIYVLEFWATWCGPCKQAMPHITELAKKFAGKVTFIGMDIWEKADSPAALDQKLDKFVKDMGDKMGYTVAQDTRDEFMSGAWMKAAGRSGIPSSFIVGRDGRIWWQGHPGIIEGALESMLAGTFDLKNSTAEAKQEQSMEAAQTEAARAFQPFETPIERALRAKDWSLVLKVADEAQAKLPSSTVMRERLLPYRIQAQAHLDPAKVQPMLEARLVGGKTSDYGTAVYALFYIRALDKRWSELALSYMDRAHSLDPKDANLASITTRFPYLLCTDPAKAEAAWEAADADTRLNLVKAITTLKGVSRPWMEKAVAVMEPRATDPVMGIALARTLARAYFELGRFKEAVAAQEKFVTFLTEKGWKGYWLNEEVEEDLKTYQAALK